MRNPVLSVISLILVSAILVITSPAQPPSSRPNKGIEDNALQFYALVNAVIVDGDRRMENATILIDGTTISAVGQATFKSARICFDDITSYAPPYAFLVITVILGTVASLKA